jgi:hypothetical protein
MVDWRSGEGQEKGQDELNSKSEKEFNYEWTLINTNGMPWERGVSPVGLLN